MPTLTELTSKFEVNKNLTQYPPNSQFKMLEWIQSNSEQCKRTTLRKLANEALIPGQSTKQKLNALYSLSRNNVILFKPLGRSRKAPKTVYINYLHKNIPKEILNNAPDGEVNRLKEEIEGISIRKEARKLLQKQENAENELIETIANHGNKAIASDTTLEVPLKTDDLMNGFSLTLNINFTINK